MSEFQWEKFMEQGGRFSYTISLNKSGGFTFNSGFYKKELISQCLFVTIFFDRSRKLVGFSFGKDKKEGSFKITHSGSNSASINPTSFIKRYNIDFKKFSGKYDVQKTTDNQHGKIFYIELKEKE